MTSRNDLRVVLSMVGASRSPRMTSCCTFWLVGSDRFISCMCGQPQFDLFLKFKLCYILL